MAKKILISAAHTKENPGAIYQDLREADLTRKMLSLLIPILEKEKIEFESVPLDLPLMQRIDWINKRNLSEKDGDIFVELHVNDGGKRGLESWFRGKSSDKNRSEQLAKHIVQNISKDTGYENIGAKSEYDHELKGLLILNQINIPGTAVELLFIDNAEDIAILKDEAQLTKMLESLAKSIKNFLDTVPIVFEEKKEEDMFFGDDDFGDDFLSQPFFAPPKAGGIDPISQPFLPKPNPASIIGNSAKTQATPTLMDRDQRKDMITNTYKKILGKEPPQNDLNYNLNIAVTEEDLTKKLLESEDFKKLVTDAADAAELKKEKQKNEAEYLNYKKQVEDSKKMIENLNKLLNMKNQYIAQMQDELQKYKVIVKGEYFDRDRVEKKKITSEKRRNRKPDIIDRVIKTLGI